MGAVHTRRDCTATGKPSTDTGDTADGQHTEPSSWHGSNVWWAGHRTLDKHRLLAKAAISRPESVGAGVELAGGATFPNPHAGDAGGGGREAPARSGGGRRGNEGWASASHRREGTWQIGLASHSGPATRDTSGVHTPSCHLPAVAQVLLLTEIELLSGSQSPMAPCGLQQNQNSQLTFPLSHVLDCNFLLHVCVSIFFFFFWSFLGHD